MLEKSTNVMIKEVDSRLSKKYREGHAIFNDENIVSNIMSYIMMDPNINNVDQLERVLGTGNASYYYGYSPECQLKNPCFANSNHDSSIMISGGVGKQVSKMMDTRKTMLLNVMRVNRCFQLAYNRNIRNIFLHHDFSGKTDPYRMLTSDCNIPISRGVLFLKISDFRTLYELERRKINFPSLEYIAFSGGVWETFVSYGHYAPKIFKSFVNSVVRNNETGPHRKIVLNLHGINSPYKELVNFRNDAAKLNMIVILSEKVLEKEQMYSKK
jgi:hypothetical protein